MALRDSDISNFEHEVEAQAKKVIQLADAYIQQWERDSSGRTIYAGFALPGTATSAVGWLIQRFSYTGNDFSPDDKLFASGELKFDKVWDDRAGYSYS